MSNVPFNSTLTWSLLQKFLFGHEYSVFLTIRVLLKTHVHTRVLRKRANDLSCERGYSSVVMRMGDWLRVLHNHGNMLVFLFNQAGLTKPKK